jgi:hypothetical protein
MHVELKPSQLHITGELNDADILQLPEVQQAIQAACQQRAESVRESVEAQELQLKLELATLRYQVAVYEKDSQDWLKLKALEYRAVNGEYGGGPCWEKRVVVGPTAKYEYFAPFNDGQLPDVK